MRFSSSKSIVVGYWYYCICQGIDIIELVSILLPSLVISAKCTNVLTWWSIQPFCFLNSGIFVILCSCKGWCLSNYLVCSNPCSNTANCASSSMQHAILDYWFIIEALFFRRIGVQFAGLRQHHTRTQWKRTVFSILRYFLQVYLQQ